MKAKETLFSFVLPPNSPKLFSQHGDDGRRLLASLIGTDKSGEIMFNYRDGKPIPDSGNMPLARMRSFGRSFMISCLRDDIAEHAYKWGLELSALIAEQYGARPVMKVEIRDIEIEPTSEAYQYAAYGTVISRKHMKAYANADEEAIVQRANEALEYGLRRQLRALGLVEPEAEDLLIDRIFPQDLRELTFLSHFNASAPLKNHCRCPGSEEVEYRSASVATFTFFLNAKIKGSWAVGGLTSLGHGRIWYCMPVGKGGGNAS